MLGVPGRGAALLLDRASPVSGFLTNLQLMVSSRALGPEAHLAGAAATVGPELNPGPEDGSCQHWPGRPLGPHEAFPTGLATSWRPRP